MSKPTLLYIGRSLPCRTETFVFHEILELKKQGWKVETVSVHTPERNLGSAELEQMANDSLFIYGQGVFLLAFHFFKELTFHPVRTIHSLFRSALKAFYAPLSWNKRLKVIVQTIAAISIAEEVRERKIEHIHAHMAHVPTTIAWVLGYHLDLPFSFTGHAADLFRDNVLLKEKLQTALFCVCVSQWHRHFYQKIEPLPDRRLPVIYCGVNRDKIRSSRAQEGLILSVGRLVPKKGFSFLLQALSILQKQGVKIQCRIIGEGPERVFLEQTIRKLGLEDVVTLMGAQAHQEIMKWISRAELFVLPCVVVEDGDRDGIPLVLMEAMAGAVPVISGALPTVRELIKDGENGLLVDPVKVNVFAQAIHQLHTDAQLRNRFAKEGMMTINEKFDLGKNTAKLGMLFEERQTYPSSTTEGRKLLIVSPCRNEAEYLERTIQSVLNQTVLPAKWVIIDDGSTDQTPALLEAFACKNPLITIVRREDRGGRLVGPGVIETFYLGLESEHWEAYDYLCKLDLDLELPSDYFESLIERMEDNPRLGTCSGKAYYKNKEGRLVSEGCGDEMSQGMTKLYRTECFKEIDGFVQEVMWDGIDCHRCRMLGWQAASWDDRHLRFLHLRPMGSSQKGIVTGRMRHGFGQYFMGTGPLYMLVSSIYRMFFPPYFIGGLSMFLGYCKAWWNRTPRYEDSAFRKFLRSYQWSCLFLGKKQATSRIDHKQEAVWLEKHRHEILAQNQEEIVITENIKEVSEEI